MYKTTERHTLENKVLGSSEKGLSLSIESVCEWHEWQWFPGLAKVSQ